jgi:phenylacetate-CoA ligase
MARGFLTPFFVIRKRLALERSCQWTRDHLARQQDHRLADLRRFVMARSPFYQRFHRGLERAPLRELPVLTKATMMESFDELVTDRSVSLADAESFLRSNRANGLFRDRYVTLSTSGSTGRRGVFLFDPDEWLTALGMITRPMAWAGLRPRLVNRPRLAMIASTTPWHYSTRVTASLSSRLLPTLRLDASERLGEIVRHLNRWQPEVLTVYPSVLKQLADEQLAGRLTISPRTIATSAEVLPAETRRRVRQAWKVHVFDTYGATEYAPISAECPRGRKHLFEDEAIIEVVDDRGRPVPSGERGDRLLLTIFNRRTQPLIRYEMSDMVRPIDGPCECGRPFRMIDSIEGRIEDVLQFPSVNGHSGPVFIHPNVFHQLLETVPASGWQVRQEQDGLSVLLTGLSDQSLVAAIGTSVRTALEAQGAHVSSVRITPVDVLQRGGSGKAPLIIANVLSISDSPASAT